MSFNQPQKDALAEPLMSENVKTREQAGRSFSYIEAWHAIAEANRIFGFDGWMRETIETRLVAERGRKIGQGQNQRNGWGVSYVAKVRVTVGVLVREGMGAGHGIDTDLGLAHESAVKEAESDAMKRALITFGNPFGLALYDKTQENVEGEIDSNPRRRSARSRSSQSSQSSRYRRNDNKRNEDKATERTFQTVEFIQLQTRLRDCKNTDQLKSWLRKNNDDLSDIGDLERTTLQSEYNEMHAKFTKEQNNGR